jgi:hypothetical protein
MVVARSMSRGFVRRLSGVLVGGLVALTLVLLAGWIYADRAGLPGPGTEMLVAHGVAAVLAMAAQVWVDRRTDVLGTTVAVGLCALVVVWLSLAWLM